MGQVSSGWWSDVRFSQVLLIAATAALFLAGCSEEQSRAKQPDRSTPPAVSVTTVSSRPFTSSVEFIGETKAFHKVEIRARVTGFLNDQAFVDGSSVEKGDLLFRIDPSEYDAALASANAGVKRAEAALLEKGQHLERTRTLAAKGTVSQAKLDDAVAAEGIFRADLVAAQTEVERAKLNLGYTEIHSPIAGRVGKSAKDVGNLIGPDSGVLATVITLDPIRVVFSISEQVYLNRQEARQRGDAKRFVPRIKLANGEIYDQEGVLRFVDNQVDPSTGTIRVFVDFPNPKTMLLPGLFVSVLLSSEEEEQRILVPQSAIQLNQSGSFVLVIDGESRVEVRSVTTGERAGAEIVVLDGLTDGETIIIEGIQKVRPGMEVVTAPAALSATVN